VADISGPFLFPLNRYVPNSDGVIWRLQCTDSALVCALGSRQQAIEVTSLIFVDFTPKRTNLVVAAAPMENEVEDVPRIAEITPEDSASDQM
jgi:hypothetical protein